MLWHLLSGMLVDFGFDIIWHEKSLFVLSHLRESGSQLTSFCCEISYDVFLFSVSCWSQIIILPTKSPPLLKKKEEETNVLHYVNQTLTCMCVYRGFIRRPMKHHAKCNYTHCAWHLAPLHKWSLQLGLMKEVICKTIQKQMTLNFSVSVISSEVCTRTLFSPPDAHITVCFFFCHTIPVWSDMTSCQITTHCQSMRATLNTVKIIVCNLNTTQTFNLSHIYLYHIYFMTCPGCTESKCIKKTGVHFYCRKMLIVVCLVEVPWEDLCYLVGEIMYGGHITDDWDRRLCRTYIQELFNPKMVRLIVIQIILK